MCLKYVIIQIAINRQPQELFVEVCVVKDDSKYVLI